MTITSRSRLRLLFLVFSIFIFSFAVFSFVFSQAISSYSRLPENLSILVKGTSTFFSYRPLSVATSVFLFSIISFIFIVYIHFAFRKIQSTEMFFFEMFLFSISFEVLRLLVPLYLFSPLILIELSAISRLLYFFRFLGVFSLLAMSLFSIKVITRQIFPITFLIFFLSLILSMSSPMDGLDINPLFMAGKLYLKRYLTLFFSCSIFLILSMIISYLYNSIRERLYIIGSMVCLLIGYFVLLYVQNYFSLLLGGSIFLAGVFNTVKNIHSIYLWQ
jgi:putative membrane protein